MHALLIGATGATGRDLLELLLKDNTFQQIDIFVRRPIQLKHEKLHIHIIDFEQPAQWQHLVKGDVLFSCLGTTLQAAGSKEAQWRIDYDYQYWFAKAARENGVSSLVLVSSGFASAKSRFFYTRMKGLLEKDVRKLGFLSLHIFNPPLLIRKNSDRKSEVLARIMLQFFNKIGLFRSQAPLPTEILAKALIEAAKNNKEPYNIYKAKAIRG